MKIRLNFMPHREVRRKEDRRRFNLAAGGAFALAIAAAIAVHGVFAGLVSVQQARNDFIKGENEKLDAKIEQIKVLRENIDSVKAQQLIIEKLQGDRAAPTQILDQLVVLTPDGVVLRTLKWGDTAIVVTGFAQSSDLVSKLMLAIQDSPYIASPELIEIKAGALGAKRMQEFAVKFVVRTQKAETAGNAASAVAASGVAAAAQPIDAASASRAGSAPAAGAGERKAP